MTYSSQRLISSSPTLVGRGELTPPTVWQSNIQPARRGQTFPASPQLSVLNSQPTLLHPPDARPYPQSFMRTLLALLAALVTATGFAQVAPSPFGPFSTPPGTPIPRHPNSPFKNLNAPPVRPLVAGKDFEEGKVLIKFKANTKLAAGAGNTRVAAEARLAQALTAAGVSELEPAVPSAHDIPRQRLPAALAADDAPRQELTRWYRAKSAQGAEQTVDALKNDPAIELVELNFMRRFAEEPAHASRPTLAWPHCRIHPRTPSIRPNGISRRLMVRKSPRPGRC